MPSGQKQAATKKEPQEYTGKEEDNAATPTPTRDRADNTHCALKTCTAATRWTQAPTKVAAVQVHSRGTRPPATITEPHRRITLNNAEGPTPPAEMTPDYFLNYIYLFVVFFRFCDFFF